MHTQRKALIIGSGEYDDSRLTPLTSAKEVEELTATLRNPAIGGFDVTVPTKKTVKEIGIEIQNFCKNCKVDDLLLIYISCHGLKDDELELFFAMSDTSIDNLEPTSVPARFVYKSLQGSKAKQKVLVLDCCFSGAFPNGETVMAAGEQIGLQTKLLGKGIQILTSSSEMQYSFIGDIGENKERRSFFTKALIEGLLGNAVPGNQKYVSVENLFTYISNRIKQYPTDRNQTPKIMGHRETEIIISHNPLFKSTEKLPSEVYAAIEKKQWSVAIELMRGHTGEGGSMPDTEEFIAGLLLANEEAETRQDYKALRETSALLGMIDPDRRNQEIRNRINTSTRLNKLQEYYFAAQAARKEDNFLEAQSLYRFLSKDGFKDSQKLLAEVTAVLDSRISECVRRIEEAEAGSQWKDVLRELRLLKTLTPSDQNLKGRIADTENRLRLPELYAEAEELARRYELPALYKAEQNLEEIIEIDPDYKKSKKILFGVKKDVRSLEDAASEKEKHYTLRFVSGWVIVGGIISLALFYLYAGFWAREGYEDGFSKGIAALAVAALGLLILHVLYRHLSGDGLDYGKGRFFSLLGFLLLPALFLIGIWVIPALQYRVARNQLETARKLIDNGRYIEAERVLTNSKNLGYEEYDLYHLMARAESKLGSFNSACETEKTAIQLNKRTVEDRGDWESGFFFDAGWDCFKAGRTDDATRFFNRVRELWPDDPDLRLRHAQTFLSLRSPAEPWEGDVKESLESLLHALAIAEGSSKPEAGKNRAKELLPEIYRELGNTYRYIDFDTSMSYFKKSIESDLIDKTYLGKTYLDRGRAYLAKKMPEEALKDAEQAVRLPGSNIDTQNFYLECLNANKNYSGVVEALKNLPEKDAVTNLRYGIALFELGNYSDSVIALDKAFRAPLAGADNISLCTIYKYKALTERKRYAELCSEYRSRKQIQGVDAERLGEIDKLGSQACGKS